MVYDQDTRRIAGGGTREYVDAKRMEVCAFWVVFKLYFDKWDLGFRGVYPQGSSGTWIAEWALSGVKVNTDDLE